ARPPEPPSALRPGLDPALDRLVVACLALDPAARPASPGLVAGALERWLDGGTGPADRLGSSASRPALQPATTDRRAWWAAALLLGAVALGVWAMRPAPPR